MPRIAGREKVLMAMYAEEMKDEGDYNRVRALDLGMESGAFLWALMCLKTEGYIDGVKWIPPGAARAADVTGLLRDRLHLTREGYEAALDITGQRGKNRAERIRGAVKWLIEAGLSAAALALEAELI